MTLLNCYSNNYLFFLFLPKNLSGADKLNIGKIIVLILVIIIITTIILVSLLLYIYNMFKHFK